MKWAGICHQHELTLAQILPRWDIRGDHYSTEYGVHSTPYPFTSNNGGNQYEKIDDPLDNHRLMWQWPTFRTCGARSRLMFRRTLVDSRLAVEKNAVEDSVALSVRACRQSRDGEL
jgi:hypothetical protein